MFGIQEARNELLDYLSNIQEETAAFKGDKEEWSILDILEHLYVIECLITDEIKKILKSNERKLAPRIKPLESTLDRSNKFKAPENMMPKSEFKSLKEAKSKLAASRDSLLEVLKKYDVDDFNLNSGRHPAFGTINVAQWIEFIGLHEKRHLAQIKESVDRYNLGVKR
jgi:hypothetical protein